MKQKQKKSKKIEKQISPAIIDNLICRFIENADPKFFQLLREKYSEKL